MALTLVMIGFLAVAAGVIVRWVQVRVDSLGRVAPFPRLGVGLALGAAMACAVPLVLHARLEGRLERAATLIAARRVEVHCQTFGETWLDAGAELGYVKYLPGGMPERKTLIKFGVCGDLKAWLRSDRSEPSRDQVVAVHVLTHETMHMRGITDESKAECAAVQRDAAMAVALGATPTQGEALAQRYWREVYPRMPDGYRRGCGPRGEFDEGFAVPPW
jgi:hypothetical protein